MHGVSLDVEKKVYWSKRTSRHDEEQMPKPQIRILSGFKRVMLFLRLTLGWEMLWEIRCETLFETLVEQTGRARRKFPQREYKREQERTQTDEQRNRKKSNSYLLQDKRRILTGFEVLISQTEKKRRTVFPFHSFRRFYSFFIANGRWEIVWLFKVCEFQTFLGRLLAFEQPKRGYSSVHLQCRLYTVDSTLKDSTAHQLPNSDHT